MRRGDVVFLKPQEARCVPSGYCLKKAGCARYLVQADQGRPVMDYTVQAIAFSSGCDGFLDASKHRAPAAGEAGRVHEAPGGIFRG